MFRTKFKIIISVCFLTIVYHFSPLCVCKNVFIMRDPMEAPERGHKTIHKWSLARVRVQHIMSSDHLIGWSTMFLKNFSNLCTEHYTVVTTVFYRRSSKSFKLSTDSGSEQFNEKIFQNKPECWKNDFSSHSKFWIFHTVCADVF